MLSIKSDAYPDGLLYPVIGQSDARHDAEHIPAVSILRQNQWIGGMGQRLFQDNTKFMLSAATTLRQNEIMPQPRAIPLSTGTLSGYSLVEYTGIPQKMLEWQGGGAAPDDRRVYLATYAVTANVPITRVYVLASNGINATTHLPQYGWILWLELFGWRYSDFVLTQNSAGTSELRILGVANGVLPTNPACYYWKATVDTPNYTKATLTAGAWVINDAGDWTQPTSGGATQTHQCYTPDGEYYSYQSTFHYPGGSVVVGANDTSNTINNIMLVNGVIVIIKPDGVYTYTKSGNLCVLKVNLRTYFDGGTGYHACQWGQLLYFNCGKLIGAFDGEKVVFLPPVWDWADPDWIPDVWGMANCGEALGVCFGDRVALFDGQDWHSFWKTTGVVSVFFTTAYKKDNDPGILNTAGTRVCPPLMIALTYSPATNLFQLYPSFFRPVAYERVAESWLVASAIVAEKDTEFMLRDFRVTCRHCPASLNIRVAVRTYLGEGYTDGFTDLTPSNRTDENGQTVFSFSFPTTVDHAATFQYRLTFETQTAITTYPTTIESIPAITDVSVEVRAVPASRKFIGDYQLLCMDDMILPDDSAAELPGTDLQKALLNAAAQKRPVQVGELQPATEDCDEMWVYRNCMISVLQYGPYAENGVTTGYINQLRVQEV